MMSPPPPVDLLCLGATDLGSVLLAIAQRHGLFEKHRLDVRLVQVPGVEVPALTRQNPLGYIGAPAALKLAAAGADLRILASFDCGRLSHRLVAAPSLTRPEHLRGKRLGARAKGAAIWIRTVLALNELGLDAEGDGIAILEIGDPVQIVQALEARRIDGAVLSRAQSRKLRDKGYSVLLDLFPADIYGAPDALVATPEFLQTHPEIAEKFIAAMVEAAVFVLSPRKQPSVLEIIKAEYQVTDTAAADEGLAELADAIVRKPYPCLERLRNMLEIMSRYDAGLRTQSITNLIDDRFVRSLDCSGFFDRTYGAI
jgi:ABC-type nitrate/sulfonate/bicarbonate transport system substrate-binding protein